MIAAWLFYALLVGVLVGGGALVVEHLLRAHRLPSRWIWAGAMGLSVLWPLGHAVLESLPRVAPTVPPPDAGWIMALEPLTVQVGPQSFLRSLDGPIVLAWGVGSALLLMGALTLLLRTHRLKKRWEGGEAGGRPVLVSDDWGPAVVGFLNPQIVLPRWYRELEEDALALILDHEAEHLRAGDLRLLLLAGLLPILVPWNLPLWWQMSRLRLAVEGDCDLRVVRKHPQWTRSYLELLIDVGRRLPQGPMAATMLSEPEETLERRIRIMTMPFPRKPLLRGLGLGVIGAALVAAAVRAPGPRNLTLVEEAAAAEAVLLTPDPQEVPTTPTFTPFTVRPEIQNREAVARALQNEYPPLLKDAGIGGTVAVWFFLDEEGRVRRALVDESSGHQALDEAALRVAEQISFTPALNNEKPVPVWISLPITFASSAASAQGDLSKTPTFTPFTVRPDIINRAEVARALEAAYPPALKADGIGGTAQVWFFIDAEGMVGRVVLNVSSGHEALDQAALEVADKIRFTPALNREKPVPVWISLPITFSVR